jgi:hypothetical protein
LEAAGSGTHDRRPPHLPLTPIAALAFFGGTPINPPSARSGRELNGRPSRPSGGGGRADWPVAQCSRLRRTSRLSERHEGLCAGRAFWKRKASHAAL